jgi:rhodanese-related sulfurtransferase
MKIFEFLKQKQLPKQITPEDAFTKIKSHNVAIIDVRERDEYETGHASGAHHIPLTALKNAEESFLDSFDELLVICRTGARSMRGAEILNSLGYVAINIEGGTVAWNKKELPMNKL